MTTKRLVKAKKPHALKMPRSLKNMFPNVKHAFDADKAIEVSVEQKDCKDGKKLDPENCALARAAKRELHADGVIIGLSSSYVIKGDTAIRFHTPQSVSREIISFDRHGDFAPGDYYLLPKPKSSRFGVPSRQYKSPRNADKVGTRPSKRKVHTSARVRLLPKGSASE